MQRVLVTGALGQIGSARPRSVVSAEQPAADVDEALSVLEDPSGRA